MSLTISSDFYSCFISQLLYNAGVDYNQSELYPIGSITALIPEAADAAISGATVQDGESGDTDFPHGNIKTLATVGEVSVCDGSIGEMIVGVPDGLGAYLKDNETVRMIVQSESYGPLALESYPFPVNNGKATFTGSHVQVCLILMLLDYCCGGCSLTEYDVHSIQSVS